MIQTIINSQHTLIMDTERKTVTCDRWPGYSGEGSEHWEVDTVTLFKSAMLKSYYPQPISYTQTQGVLLCSLCQLCLRWRVLVLKKFAKSNKTSFF